MNLAFDAAFVVRARRVWIAIGLLVSTAMALPRVTLAAPEYSVVIGPYSASNTNDAQVNVGTMSLSVIPKGQTFSVDTCDSPVGTTYLRVFAGGQLLTSGTGGCPTGSGGTRLTSLTMPATEEVSVQAGCAGNGSCSGRLRASSPVGVVERWAPVVYQATAIGVVAFGDASNDYITNFNFDGDYQARNNWDHADMAARPDKPYPLKAHIYFSHVETKTHHFIGYYFFHPKDSSCDLDQHENDLEGTIFAIKKHGLYGDIIAMETEAHGHLYEYVTPGLGTTEIHGVRPDGEIAILGDEEENPRTQRVEPMLVYMAGHPKVFAQHEGHGVFGCGDYQPGDRQINCGDNDGVVYAWKNGRFDDPNVDECDPGGHKLRFFELADPCGYKLVSLDDWGGSTKVADPSATQGFWVLQNDICRDDNDHDCVFNSFTNFRGDGSGNCGGGFSCTCSENSPNPPWQWVDHPGVGSGDWLSDPARLFDAVYEGPEFTGDTFSHEYVKHPYYTHEIQLVGSRLNPSDLGQLPYLSVFVRSSPESGNESNAITKYHWKKDSPEIGVWYPWFYGADQASHENMWSQPNVNRYYFTRQTQDRTGDGAFVNGGRSMLIAISNESNTSRTAPALAFIEPNDWASGTCSLADDSGCVGASGAYDYCRVQVNDFTCGDGFTGTDGNLLFKLTRIRRPTLPPVAAAGPDRIVECDSPTGTQVALDGSGSSDPDGAPITYQWSGPGIQFADANAARTTGTFPLGSTEVTLTVSDGGQDVSDTVLVTVQDTTPPSVTVALTPSVLSPADHRLVDVAAAVTATDRCDPKPRLVLTSLTSNEPDNGLGDGDTAGDIRGAVVGTADFAYQLRAERSAKGAGRIYRATYTATDQQGRATSTVGEVRVPKSSK